jgi:hypothetical protein
MFVAALGAHERLTQGAPFDVFIAEVPRAFSALSACFMGAAWRCAFHSEEPTHASENRSIENRLLSVDERGPANLSVRT